MDRRVFDPEELEQDPEWTLTDPDTNQWVRQAAEHVYYVYEGDVQYFDSYDIGQMTIEEIEDVVNDYFPSLERMITVSNRASEDGGWEMLVAEMLSEQNAPAQPIPQQKSLLDEQTSA